jgi:hypothetical protein
MIMDLNVIVTGFAIFAALGQSFFSLSQIACDKILIKKIMQNKCFICSPLDLSAIKMFHHVAHDYLLGNNNYDKNSDKYSNILI